ncbi:MAG: TraC family protein [Proteobacteria bacterium]|nr:TraC family protein [Pseudomonadota bacterium]
MFKEFNKKISSFFGEGSQGINTDYIPLASMAVYVDKFWKYLPYDTYDSETQLFFNRGSTGFVLLATPIARASLNDQNKIDKFFNQKGNLPEGCSMQFLLVASPRIEKQLDYWKSYRTNPDFQALTQRRYDYLKKKAFDKTNPIRDFKVLISYTLPNVIASPVEKDDLVRLRENLQGSFEKIGLYSRALDDKGLIREVGNILNFEESTKQDECWYSEYEEISRLIPSFDINGRIDQDGLFLRDDKFVAHSFLPSNTPKHWALGHMDKLFGGVLNKGETIPCAFLMHYGFTVCEDQNTQKRRAIAKRETYQNTINNPLAKWQTGIEEDFAEATEVLNEIQRGERVIDACLSLTTICEPHRLASVKSTVESIWNEYGWSSESATYNHHNLFLASMPMMWTTGSVTCLKGFRLKKEVIGAGATLKALGVTRKTITKEPQNLLPIVGEWTGQRAPGIPLVGPNGQLAFWTPFDGRFIPGNAMYKTPGNFNFCITGVPGSGKSFLCNELIMNTIAVGGKAFVLDKGGSFKNLCLSQGGHHINFDHSTDFSLNPFTHIPEGNTQDELDSWKELMSGFQSILRQMAFPSGTRCDVKESFLKEALYHVWDEKKSTGCIDDIYDLLNSHKDTRAQDIARCLLDFTSKGIYGSFFNPPANIDVNSDFVVIETDNLEEPLKGVMVMMMMVQVWQRMIKSSRKFPFLVLIDEGWDLLRGKVTGDFLEAMALTSRKYRFSLGVATQSLEHFFDNERSGPKAAWANSAWKIIFNQEGDTLSGLKEHPQLKELLKDSYRETLLRSLKPATTYSEMVLQHSDVPSVPCRLYCDDYSTLLYSTDSDEVALLRDLQASGKSLDESIQHILDARQKEAA